MSRVIPHPVGDDEYYVLRLLAQGNTVIVEEQPVHRAVYVRGKTCRNRPLSQQTFQRLAERNLIQERSRHRYCSHWSLTDRGYSMIRRWHPSDRWLLLSVLVSIAINAVYAVWRFYLDQASPYHLAYGVIAVALIALTGLSLLIISRSGLLKEK